MEFGLFMELSVPRPWTPDSERRVYENAIEQVRLADELGFDYVWAVEHHFLEEYSHCSGPDIFLAACAAQTSRIRVGHGIIPCVPEYQSPIRVAERAAVLDIISGGRVELGTGRSATWPELSGFGADPDETKKTWDEFVRVIPQMWMNERFSWEGRMFSMPERAVLPKPIQQPHPPMWVAVTSPGTEVDAADRGLGCLGLSPANPAESEKKVANYRKRIKVCEPVGAFVNEKVLTVNFLSCCEDGDLGRRNGLKIASIFGYMAAQLLSAKEVLPTHSYPSEGLLPALRREAGSPGDAMKAFKGVTMGTPDDVAAAVTHCENVGFDGINFIHQFMEVVPQQYVLDSMRLFAEEVMPRFKTSSSAAAGGSGGAGRGAGAPAAERVGAGVA
jgi:alkanesulfonate monooxygenase SsuD/methylene tetrahydromethanopterin reductase-like flavin-dependent oxidoreductase (luciferase family)